MRRVWLLEWERLHLGGEGDHSARVDGRVVLSPAHFRMLGALDERLAGGTDRTVFRWGRKRAQARQWIGVLQVPGLSVEILPKTENRQQGIDDGGRFARKNLLYMLSLAGEVAVRERELASQALQTSPLLESLVALFAQRLLDELHLGREHRYVTFEDDRPVLRGKLLFSEHIKRNSARRDRFRIAFDEFSPDTPMNRVLKSACALLMGVTKRARTQESLAYCLMLFNDVGDVAVSPEMIKRVALTRQNERFHDLFRFARMVLLGQAPTGATGDRRTFSLLWDMNQLYETFITEFIRRYVLSGEQFSDWRMYPQSKNRREHLVFTPPRTLPEGYRPRQHGRGTLRLKPDIVLERGQLPDRDTVVIDTKWKNVDSTKARRGVARSDLYQLFAYAHTYNAQRNVLLYPKTAGSQPIETFDLPLRVELQQHIDVRFVDLDRDLRASRAELINELGAVLEPLLHREPPAGSQT